MFSILDEQERGLHVLNIISDREDSNVIAFNFSKFLEQHSDLDFTTTDYLMTDMAPNFKNTFEKSINSNCQWLWLWL